MSSPLAELLRPTSLDEVVGQSHIMPVLCSIAESGKVPNMIFYGPPGIGKTTVARIIAKRAGKKLHSLNGTTASTADIKAVIAELETFGGIDGIVLYLDEIQYFNKKQQQTLLEFMENGQITLIASTTENPYFYVYNAILSRSTVFEFKPVSPEEIKTAVLRAFKLLLEQSDLAYTIEDGVAEVIALSCGGDVRKALNIAEVCTLAAKRNNDDTLCITKEIVSTLTGKSSLIYDKNGDQHYNILSAFQKSIRGSDENAALHYLARLLEAGDMVSPCRRLMVIASEDIGLAYPNAIAIVKSCIDCARELGLPEARIPLAQAVIMLCTAPKSNSALTAIDSALEDVRAGNYSDVPSSLKDGHYQGAKKLGNAKGYIYPHNEKNHYAKQQYLPDKLVSRVYYQFGENKTEKAAQCYRNKVLSES